MVNDATVTTADVVASNGIVHIIDKVLMPPADETPVTLPTTTEAPPSIEEPDTEALIALGCPVAMSRLSMAILLMSLCLTGVSW